MNKEHTIQFEAVIDEIMLEESKPSHDVLMRWIARYPEHQEALTRFFATWAVQEASPKEKPVDEALVGQRMVSQAMDLLYKQKAARAAVVKPEKALRLCDAVKAQAMSEEEFETRTGLDDLIVAKLDRRLIRRVSIPHLCFERIAAALKWTVDEVLAVLTGDPIPLKSYKAKERPAVKVEDFVDAVRSSNLSDDAKAEWIEAVAAEVTKKGAQ